MRAIVAIIMLVGACSSSDEPCGDGVQHGSGPPYGTLSWCARSDGTKQGPWTEWHAVGTVKSNGHYVDGKMDGLWTTFRKDGRKASEGAYQAGRKIGTWTTWNEDGSRQRESVHATASDSVTWTAFRPTGQRWATG